MCFLFSLSIMNLLCFLTPSIPQPSSGLLRSYSDFSVFQLSSAPKIHFLLSFWQATKAFMHYSVPLMIGCVCLQLPSQPTHHEEELDLTATVWKTQHQLPFLMFASAISVSHVFQPEGQKMCLKLYAGDIYPFKIKGSLEENHKVIRSSLFYVSF